jgi:hypothetical protein
MLECRGESTAKDDVPGNGEMTENVEKRRAVVGRQMARLAEAVRKGDDKEVQAMVVELSRQHRYLTPLAFAVGAVAMLFEGVKLLVTNWRLTLIQLLPAMWIWAAMIDLKAHVPG